MKQGIVCFLFTVTLALRTLRFLWKMPHWKIGKERAQWFVFPLVAVCGLTLCSSLARGDTLRLIPMGLIATFVPGKADLTSFTVSSFGLNAVGAPLGFPATVTLQYTDSKGNPLTGPTGAVIPPQTANLTGVPNTPGSLTVPPPPFPIVSTGPPVVDAGAAGNKVIISYTDTTLGITYETKPIT